MIRVVGRARVLGDDVNTDYIITSKRKRETIDPHSLKRHLLETVDPGFAASVEPGDILVAGRNFGCGSAMEVAATVVLAAGIPVVVARNFARTYYRNAINNGLIPIECDTGGILEGDVLEIGVSEAGSFVFDTSRDIRRTSAALPAIMLAVLDAGGLVPYMRAHGRFEVSP